MSFFPSGKFGTAPKFIEKRIKSATALLLPASPNSPKKKPNQTLAKVAPSKSPRSKPPQLQRRPNFEEDSSNSKSKQSEKKGGSKKMRQHEVILEDQQLNTNGGGGGEEGGQQQPGMEKDSSTTGWMIPMRRPKSGPAKKWTSAFRVVQSMTRWKNMPKRHHHGGNGEGGSRGSSFSGSNESTPTRTMTQQEQEELIDPVYLALKQATAKYGSTGANGPNGGNGSRSGSRRSSQCALAHGHLFDSATPSPRNLSQTSLQDSGYSGGPGDIGGSRARLIGSTPHLHGVGAIGGPQIGGGAEAAKFAAQNGGGGGSAAGGPSNGQAAGAQGGGQPNGGGGRRPKLSEKMKSLSLDCEGMPAPVQAGFGRNQYFKSKPIRSARGFAASGDSFEDALERSLSPPSARPFQPRRLPPAPPQQPQQQPHSARAQQNGAMPATQAVTAIPAAPVKPAPMAAPIALGPTGIPIGTHIVIHEYIYGDCCLYLGDRLVVVDNGDPDWKHGFKVNDRLEQLYTFPSTCVAAFQPEEQPMRLIQNCNLIEQKLRLYRDQVVFVQPNSLREDGRVMIRNEHGTYAYCPLQFLMMLV